MNQSLSFAVFDSQLWRIAIADQPAKMALGALASEVVADGALQPRGTLAQGTGQVLQVVTSSDAELANEILGSSLQIAVVVDLLLVLGSSKVSVRRNG